MTEEQLDSTREHLPSRVRKAFDAGGVEDVVAALKSIDDPTGAGVASNDLAQHLYQARKDVTSMIAVAEAGVAFCLERAKHAQSPEIAKKLKETAKIIAFNAGANCWPGWGDECVEIAPAHIRSGLKLAEVSRDLVRELQLGPKQDGNGTWLIGALKLAAGAPTAALADFQEALGLAESGGDAAGVLLATGYCALARKADPATAAAGARELEAAVARLRALDSNEAKFFAAQLVTADEILLVK
jgi:hypothetical protein